jgi:DNA-binding transcriptional LysR family regulator
MDLRQLEIFRAVMENRSATRAAAALGVTQPAVSAQIARLESQVGFALFDRKAGRLEPTSEALLLYGEVTQSLSGIDRLMQAILDIKQAQAGRLVIASQPGAAIALLPRVAAAFLRERPGVTIRFVTRSSQTIKNLIPPEAFDLGLAEPPLDGSGLEVQRFRMRCVAVLPKDHPCATRRTITPRLLDGKPFIAMFREHMTFHSVGRAFDEAGARWNVCAETEFFATACALAASGAGACVVDPFAAADFAGRGIVARPFEPAVPYELALFRSASRPPSRLAVEFAAALEARLVPFLDR